MYYILSFWQILWTVNEKRGKTIEDIKSFLIDSEWYPWGIELSKERNPKKCPAEFYNY
jgi:hypothetical protein